jgi:hypothetical protein
MGCDHFRQWIGKDSLFNPILGQGQRGTTDKEKQRGKEKEESDPDGEAMRKMEIRYPFYGWVAHGGL